MSVHQFPLDRASATVRLGELANRLGLADRATATIVRTVRLLIAERSFPDPLAPRIWRGRLLTGPDAVTARATWDRNLVDLWFDHGVPARVAVLSNAAERARLDALVDTRIAAMGGR